MKYYYELEDILNYDEKSIRNWLELAEGKKLSELTVKDLVFYNDTPIRTGNGVYIFKENNIPLYVGNCVARNFVERIPAHFDIRHNGWFNSLLVNLINRSLPKKIKENKTDENLTQVAKDAFENLDLILINFPNYDRLAIKRLEVYLRITLKPLNGYKHKKLKGENITVREYLDYYNLNPH